MIPGPRAGIGEALSKFQMFHRLSFHHFTLFCIPAHAIYTCCCTTFAYPVSHYNFYDPRYSHDPYPFQPRRSLHIFYTYPV